MFVVILGVLLLAVGAALDSVFRLRMFRIGQRWALLEGGAFDYSRYHNVREEHGWAAWPVYLMWVALACGIALLIAGFFAYFGTSPTQAQGALSADPCDLPKDLRTVVAAKYPGRSLVNLSDLDVDDREIFQKEHRESCPGLVQVDFYGDGKPTFALVLNAKSVAKGKTELVVAHQSGAVWATSTVETTDGAVPVVWSQKPGDYTDVYGEKKIRAANPVIVFCGYSAWAILYAWENNKIAKIWLAD